MKYYLKKCGFQELGSVGLDGKPRRGRYLMTSMNADVLAIFPPLSRAILNDCAVLPVIPLYTGKKTYCNYVYHNSKFNGGEARNKRNEYRIYLNKELEAHQLYFAAQDIMILRQAVLQESSDITDEEQAIYYMDVLKDHSSGDYICLSRLVESYPISGGYGIYDGELDFFEAKVKEVEAAQISQNIVIDKSVTDRIVNSNSQTQQNLFNPATFRDFVLAGYGNACAVTGKITESAFGGSVDVVYIRPRTAGGSCLPSNGVALENKLSLPFIQGYFTLSDDYEVRVHPQTADEYIQSLNLKQIRVPPSAFFRPDKGSLQYHREHIYGAFTKTI
jgi:hypothetical protein